MGNSDINLNFTKVSEVLTSWDKSLSLFGGTVKPLSSDSSLTELMGVVGVSGGIAEQFDKNCKALADAITGAKTLVSAVAAEFQLIDDVTKSRMPGGGGGGNNPPPYTQETIVDSQIYALFQGMSYEDFLTIVNALHTSAKLNNVSLETLLTDEQYEQTIKDIFVKNESISPDVKQLIDSSVKGSVQLALKSLITGGAVNGFNIDDANEDTVILYLEKIAKDNNITLNELVNDEKNYELLKKGLSDFKEVNKFLYANASSENFGELLNKIATGEDVSGVSKECSSILSIFFKNGKHTEGQILNELDSLNKNASYLNNLTSLEQKTVSDVLGKVLEKPRPASGGVYTNGGEGSLKPGTPSGGEFTSEGGSGFITADNKPGTPLLGEVTSEGGSGFITADKKAGTPPPSDETVLEYTLGEDK